MKDGGSEGGSEGVRGGSEGGREGGGGGGGGSEGKIVMQVNMLKGECGSIIRGKFINVTKY